MKDSYSCDRDWEGLEASYALHEGAYRRIFERLGLEVVAVGRRRRGHGRHRGPRVHVPEPTSVRTRWSSARTCDYAANQQIAHVGKPEPAAEELLPMEDVETPGATTIDALATFLGVGPERTAKAAFFMTGDGRFVVAIVRGDYDVEETKLGNAVKAIGGLRPAHVEEITSRGMEAGYGSPIGARDAVVVVDDLVTRSPNLVAGANRVGWHVRNVNVPRDYTPDIVADITSARAGDPCPRCGSPLRLENGIEVGNIFKLGTDFAGVARGVLPRRGRRAPSGRHGLLRHRARAQPRLRRRGPPRREGHRLAGRSRPVPGPPRRHRDRQGSSGRRDRRAPPRRREGSGPRDPVRRSI